MAHRWARRTAELEHGVELRRRRLLRRQGRAAQRCLLARADAIEAALADAPIRNLVSLVLADMDPPGRWTARQNALIAVVLGRPAHEWEQDVSPYERGVLSGLLARWTATGDNEGDGDDGTA